MNITSDVSTASLKKITMCFFGNRENAVRFANDIGLYFVKDFRSITIIRLEQSEDYYVRIATDMSSVDIVKTTAQSYSLQPTNISQENTQDG